MGTRIGHGSGFSGCYRPGLLSTIPPLTVDRPRSRVLSTDRPIRAMLAQGSSPIGKGAEALRAKHHRDMDSRPNVNLYASRRNPP